MRRPSPPLLPLLLLLALGCATAPAPPPAAAPPAAPVAESWDGRLDEALLAEVTDDVRWVAASAEYRAAVWQAFDLATERVEELASGRAAGTWAVSVDADETILGNVGYEIERRHHETEFDQAAWQKWVDRRQAIALPGARQFLGRVRELGGLVVVVTNRRDAERSGTEGNLRMLGLPFDLLLTRQGESDKEGRWDAVAAGAAGLPPLEIVLWVGDNVNDFPHLDQSLAQAPETALAPFGERFVIVPNPMYGSWKD
jgi:5'-nucleotidase (lipoprotein e(P4) family)